MIAINYQKKTTKKETSHIKEKISQRKNYRIKYYHSWGSHFATSFLYLGERFVLLGVIELVTLYISELAHF